MFPDRRYSSPSAPVGKGVVLVVDDDAAVLGSLKFALEVDGFGVQVFRSAEELLKLGMPPSSACLIVDQVLPNRTGLQLVALLRSRGARLPAILITSHPSAALRHEAAAANVTIVEKPLLGNALSETIARVIA